MTEHTAAHTDGGHEEHHFVIEEQGLHEIHSTKKEIWKVFFILLAITLLEFLIALTPSIKHSMSKGTVIVVYLFLTLLKAFYIVGYFMHLRHEKMNMAYTILIPFMFIIYFVTLMILEGKYQVF
ncbi:MAG: cytochrome C oxidase subunit IV family protein [Bacteroidetes bacterium]|nr:cytochrome C oxidase subunit IV family protein [Bacteroidota bacterium]